MGTPPPMWVTAVLVACLFPITVSLVASLLAWVAGRRGRDDRATKAGRIVIVTDLFAIPAAYIAGGIFFVTGAWIAGTALIIGGTMTAWPYARWAQRRRKVRRGVVS